MRLAPCPGSSRRYTGASAAGQSWQCRTSGSPVERRALAAEERRGAGEHAEAQRVVVPVATVVASGTDRHHRAYRAPGSRARETARPAGCGTRIPAASHLRKDLRVAQRPAAPPRSPAGNCGHPGPLRAAPRAAPHSRRPARRSSSSARTRARRRAHASGRDRSTGPQKKTPVGEPGSDAYIRTKGGRCVCKGEN